MGKYIIVGTHIDVKYDFVKELRTEIKTNLVWCGKDDWELLGHKKAKTFSTKKEVLKQLTKLRRVYGDHGPSVYKLDYISVDDISLYKTKDAIKKDTRWY